MWRSINGGQGTKPGSPALGCAKGSEEEMKIPLRFRRYHMPHPPCSGDWGSRQGLEGSQGTGKVLGAQERCWGVQKGTEDHGHCAGHCQEAPGAAA